MNYSYILRDPGWCAIIDRLAAQFPGEYFTSEELRKLQTLSEKDPVAASRERSRMADVKASRLVEE